MSAVGPLALRSTSHVKDVCCSCSRGTPASPPQMCDDAAARVWIKRHATELSATGGAFAPPPVGPSDGAVSWVRVVCAMCARAVSERGAKRRSPPLRHPHTVLLPVSTLQAVAESSVGCLHGWRCAVACPLLACACSFGRWQRSRVQAKSEYTHQNYGGYYRSPSSLLRNRVRFVGIWKPGTRRHFQAPRYAGA